MCFEEVGDVGGRVFALIDGQRPPQPVGEAVALGRADPELTLQQGNQRRRAVADETTGHLRVEQVVAGCTGRRA